MAFNNYNGNSGYNNQNNNGEEKKKTNFNVGRLWGADGVVDLSIWNSDKGVKTIISGKSSVGKDPSTGANVYEQKKPNELPRFFMNVNQVRAILDAVDGVDPSTLNIVMDKGQAGKLTITGSNTEIKFTIDSCKAGIGARTVTFPAINLGGRNIHSDFNIFIEYLKVCYKKGLYVKLDENEFGMAVASEDDANLPI